MIAERIRQYVLGLSLLKWITTGKTPAKESKMNAKTFKTIGFGFLILAAFAASACGTLEIEKEPTIEELQALVPGYKERILAGVLAEIERRAQADALADRALENALLAYCDRVVTGCQSRWCVAQVKASSGARMKRRALIEALIRMESISPCDALVGRRGF